VSRLLVAAVVVVSACSGTIKSPHKTRLTTREIVDQSKPGIVRIESSFGEGQNGVGTGFIVDSSGLVATNMHVLFDVEGELGVAKRVDVVLLDGRRFPVINVISADPKRDLAVVKIDASGSLPVLSLGDSDKMSAGDRVIAIGNPLGVLDYTVSDGLISSVRPVSEDLTMLQISAPISQGSSGGPLFNNFGEVIGVATAISREGQNLNFAIPSNYLRPMVNKTGGLTLSELGAKFQPPDRKPAAAPSVVRRVPRHDIASLDACEPQAVATAVQAISDAISVGAPVYNSGDHEACYRIYEGTALRLERDSDCKIVREALGQGLLRAQTLENGTERAWAMRDAFDGLLDVVQRKLRGANP
jgi:hypothetical protein